MNYFEDRVIDLLDAAIPELERDVIQSSIEIPPDVKLGHFAFPCFKLAKIYRNAPNKIAPELKEKIGEVDFLERVEAVGPYLNFFISKPAIAEYVLTRILDEKDRYGSSNMGKGKKVLVEFSSTNIAKPFHIGHIRSTVIGNVLRNIYRFLGFDTVAINHLGDYGTQFGMAIAAYKRWGDEETIAKDPIREILKLYVRFNEEAEKTPPSKMKRASISENWNPEMKRRSQSGNGSERLVLRNLCACTISWASPSTPMPASLSTPTRWEKSSIS